MKDLKDILVEALNEGLESMFHANAKLEKDDAEKINNILKSYGNTDCLKEYHYDGDTLVFSYPGGGFIKDFQNMADEIGCKSFEFAPQLIIQNTPLLKGLQIIAANTIQIDCPCKIENCELRVLPMGSGVIAFMADKSGNLSVRNTNVIGAPVLIKGLNKFNLQGSNFKKVEELTLTEIGPNIRKVVESWGICDIKNNRFVVSSGKFDPSIDPLKDLGLDKNFNNGFWKLYITLDDGKEGKCLCYEGPNSFGPKDRGVLRYEKLNNGWVMYLIDLPAWVKTKTNIPLNLIKG